MSKNLPKFNVNKHTYPRETAIKIFYKKINFKEIMKKSIPKIDNN